MECGYVESQSIEYISRKRQSLGLLWKDTGIAKRELNDEIVMARISDEIGQVLFAVHGERILNVGCGLVGLVIALKLRRAAEAIGFDDSEEAVRICSLRAKYCGISCKFFAGKASRMPYPDNYFDLVTATVVLEHVRSPALVIWGLVRVCHCAYFILTNPLSPRGGHYKIFWVSFMSNMIGARYLRLRGYKTEFFENYINYLPPSKVETSLTEQGMVVRNITRGDFLESREVQSESTLPRLGRYPVYWGL